MSKSLILYGGLVKILSPDPSNIGGLALNFNFKALTDIIATLSPLIGSTNINTLGTVTIGTWNATTIAIPHGGTGQTTQQTAIDALTNVSSATNEYVLTKDTSTGHAIFKVAAGGGGSSPSGSSGYIQYYATSSTFGADANFTRNPSTFETIINKVLELDVTGKFHLGIETFNFGDIPGALTVVLNSNTEDHAVVGCGDLSALGFSTEAVFLVHESGGHDEATLIMDEISNIPTLTSSTYYANGNGFKLTMNAVNFKIEQIGSPANSNFIIDSSGRIGLLNITSPSAYLSLAAGSESIAPLLFATGLNLDSPSDGAMEYNGYHLYFTIGSTRYQLDTQIALGTVTTGTWNATTIAIDYGGTGQTTANAAFNALSPMTSSGDIIYGGASGAGTRLGIGTDGQVLTILTGSPVWGPANQFNQSLNTTDSVSFSMLNVGGVITGASFTVGNTAGFTGSGTYVNFTINGGIITGAS